LSDSSSLNVKCDFFFFFPESKKATVLRQNNTKNFFSKPKHNKHQHATTMRDDEHD